MIFQENHTDSHTKNKFVKSTESDAKLIMHFGSSKDKQEEWLEKLYNSESILQDIYRYLFAFKKTVFDTLKDYKESELVEVDDRQDYNIIPTREKKSKERGR